MADQPEIGGVASAGKPLKAKDGIFISYARTDGKAFAGKLRDTLEGENLNCWQDIVGMEGGRDWWTQIQDAINNVEFLVLVMTPAAMRSKTVRKEWRFARQQGVCVYPVIATPKTEFDPLINQLPRWMRDSHFYDLGHDTEHFERGSNWLRFLNDLRSKCEVPRVPFMADDLGVYIQRSKEYDALIALLIDTDRDEPKAITSAFALKGAGGYGKTTLARAICHDERIQEAFDDGILWVTLGESATMDTVRQQIDSLITVLSGQRYDAPSLEAAKTHLRELMADRDILLVIDDVWKRDHLEPFLQGGARVARLITTRMGESLPDRARKVDVNEMARDEAYALLTVGLPADQAEAQRERLAALTARLGEYPLLLKLANGILNKRAQERGVDKALDYLDELYDEYGINLGDRERKITGAIRASIRQLTDEERGCYEKLAIFSDDVDIPLTTLARLWAVKPIRAELLCETFLSFSLLLRYDEATQTIRLHDVIRRHLVESAADLRGMHNAFLDRYALTHWRDLPTDEPYLWDHLAYHLIEAERGDDLITTALDLRYLARKTSVRGTAAAEADLLDAAKRETTTPALELLTRNYRNLAHILARCADEKDTLNTLYARLNHLTELQAACAALETTARPRIEPVRALPDLPHPALIRTLTGHGSYVTSASFSPDGTRIVSASSDNTLKLWDAVTGAVIRTLTGHDSDVNSAAFSPDGTRIISASRDNTLKLWDAATGADIRTLTGHTNGVTSAAFSPDGRMIVSASRDNTLKLWDAENGICLATFYADAPLLTCAWSPDGVHLVAGGGMYWLRWVAPV